MTSIRSIIHTRDNLSPEEISDMFEEFQLLVAEGEDPEQALSDVFGLEPDYIFDRELGVF